MEKRTYQEGGLPLLLELLPELALLVVAAAPLPAVVVAPAPPAAVVVGAAPPFLQNPSYQVCSACKSLGAEQLAAPHTLATSLVPCKNGVRRVSLQKHCWLAEGWAGGAQAPCTSKRGPHLEAQAGRVEKGTMAPLGCAWAFVKERRVRRGMMVEVEGYIAEC